MKIIDRKKNIFKLAQACLRRNVVDLYVRDVEHMSV